MVKKFDGERIAKVMARAGLCSRREAERWIGAGRVKVDGEVIVKPGFNVTDENVIEVDGKKLNVKEKSRLWLMHKPKGVITSHSDPEGRKTVFDILPDDMPRVISVGRLDYNTEGLLILTNDGELSRYMELPDTGWVRKYKVRAYGKLDNKKIDELKRGTVIDGIKYAPSTIKVEKKTGDNCWLMISITEGKNREVRKMLEYAGLKVNRLIRLSYGPFKLGKLSVGKVVEVDSDNIKEQIGFGK